MPHSIKRRLFISLGRTGDIINILPVVKAYSDAVGIKPAIMVAKDFAPLLEGITYADTIVWNGPWQNCVDAEDAARLLYPQFEIVNCAVYGIGYKFKRVNCNFQREAWRLAGASVPWGRLPLVFDNRDRDREAALVRKLMPDPTRPMILTAFSGVSTPFTGGGPIIQAIRKLEPAYQVIDLSRVHAERFYDVLGLMEIAKAFVCSDSAPMHMADACPNLPIVALIQDRTDRWQRSEWMPSHFARMWYSEATVRPDLVAQAVVAAAQYQIQDLPRLIHVYSYAGEVDSETDRRMRTANQSWLEEGLWAKRWDEMGVGRDQLTRDTTTVYKDPGACPFYRDVIDLARSKCRPEDIIVYTNADVGCAPGITGWIIDAMIRSESVFTHRWDSDVRIDHPLISEHQVAKLKWYPGSDMWAFTGRFWDKWGHEYPDMAMGREAGDLLLRHLMKNHGGVEIPACIWHEKHASFWEHHGRRDTLPGNLQNRLYATEFLRVYGGDWNDGAEVRP